MKKIYVSAPQALDGLLRDDIRATTEAVII